MNPELLQCASGSGKYLVSARALRCGDDWCITVCGGEAAHIGAVSLGQYEPLRGSATVSTITVFTHRDDAVASCYAKAVASQCKCCVSVSAGIHVDNADAADLAVLKRNYEDCLQRLLQAIEETICD